eukprot:COSAG05_NODE_3647_length_1935_cov_0.949346_2_plen_100_part_00
MPPMSQTVARVPETGSGPEFGVWVSREEWKRQQVEVKRGAEAYNQLLQEIEKKDRAIEALRGSADDATKLRMRADERVRAAAPPQPDRTHATELLPPCP